jgi:hypothetical protein
MCSRVRLLQEDGAYHRTHTALPAHRAEVGARLLLPFGVAEVILPVLGRFEKYTLKYACKSKHMSTEI